VANTSWNIQVGAFPAKEQADAKLAALRGRLGPVLTGKQSFTVQVENKGKYLYRARFAGFDAMTAKKACNRISRLGTSCLAIAPQG
jgi:D-alanyl-D-alanine carboxypeptidase